MEEPIGSRAGKESSVFCEDRPPLPCMDGLEPKMEDEAPFTMDMQVGRVYYILGGKRRGRSGKEE